MVTPFSAIYEQSRGAGSSDGEGATKDRRNVSQRCWSDLVLSHPQLSFDHAQAGPFHVGCTGCGLCRQAFACRLGTYVVTKNYKKNRANIHSVEVTCVNAPCPIVPDAPLEGWVRPDEYQRDTR